MEKYGVFKSQNGYAVALCIYNDSPIMGQCYWFETEELANQFSKNYKLFQEHMEEWDEKCMDMMPCKEEDFPCKPNFYTYKIPKGIRF